MIVRAAFFQNFFLFLPNFQNSLGQKALADAGIPYSAVEQACVGYVYGEYHPVLEICAWCMWYVTLTDVGKVYPPLCG